MTLPRFRAAVDRALGRPAAIAEARWLTRFGDAARLAERLRHGRVFLAGDAAHIHPPAGAIGVNAAIDDAMALGWRLALAHRSAGCDSVLDAYHAERHAAGARLLRDTRAQALLGRGDEEWAPVRDLLADLASSPGTAGPLAETITAVATQYPVRHPCGHPWEGRAVPDVPAAPAGLFDLLARTGRGVLLTAPGALAEPLREAAEAWADRVTAAVTAPGALPGVPAVLVRPDGHAAWVAAADRGAEAAAEGLLDTLTADFGPPSAAVGHHPG